MLPTRLCESTLLVYPICQADMRGVAFVTDNDSVCHILEYIGILRRDPGVILG